MRIIRRVGQICCMNCDQWQCSIYQSNADQISLNSRKTDITQVTGASGDWEVDKTILSGATITPGLGNMVKYRTQARKAKISRTMDLLWIDFLKFSDRASHFRTCVHYIYRVMTRTVCLKNSSKHGIAHVTCVS